MFMNQFNSLKRRLRGSLGLAAIAAALFTVSFTFVKAQDAKVTRSKTADTNAPVAQASEAKPAQPPKPKKKKLTGAELYSVNCNRCHAERYPTEFTPGQWKTVMIHMRVRANLPAAQAREVLKYLQADSGN